MFAGQQRDGVSNIHRRWSLTRFNPSSFSNSFAISVGCAVGIVIATLFHLHEGLQSLTFHLPLAVAAVGIGHILDFAALRGTPINKLSKVSHVAAFANGLWLLTLALGTAADFVFGRQLGSGNYIIAGMLLSVGLRIGIFNSVFGASTPRAIGVSFIQPLIILFAVIPMAYYPTLQNAHIGLAFGITIVLLGIGWTFVADRAGRPSVTSTFRLLQAFLSAWSDRKVDKIEEFTDSRAREETVSTMALRFKSSEGNDQSYIILPDVHPGPFGTVGGSNLPYVLHNSFNNRALVMHSVSDHSLNIPSQKEVSKYVKSLSKLNTVFSGSVCSIPIQSRKGKATATGFAFGKGVVLFLSLAPDGMDDIPAEIRKELEDHSSSKGFSRILIVDCHNAMGDDLTETERQDLVAAGKDTLAKLAAAQQYEFAVGFASIATPEELREEIGQAGVGAMVFKIQNQSYGIGWIDANNMENSLRDKIISSLTTQYTVMLEVCTSDTHSTSGKRTKQGYYELGSRTAHGEIINLIGSAVSLASSNLSTATFELAVAESKIRVMGENQFEDYSRALDRSIKVTKGFLVVTAITYIAMLIFSY